MNYLVRRFRLRLEIIILLFEDLELILKIALENIDKEKLTDPYLTIPILENYTGIASDYKDTFKYFLKKEVDEINLDSIKGLLGAFARSFEDPLPYSEDWSPKIVRIRDDIRVSFGEIVDFLEKREK